MTKLKDKTIWITGASSGIGKALAIALSDDNNNLILSARREDELEKVKNLCLAYGEATVEVLAFDLADEKAIQEGYNKIKQMFGGIDILINNGGISQRSAVTETDISVTRKIMDVNFFSYVNVTKAVLPDMIRDNSGHIVVTSSLVGKFGTPMRSAYSSSKHALHGFFDSLRAEVYKHNINVTLFCPGYINTEVSINALKGDGSSHGKMDENQKKGKSANECAWRIMKAIENNRDEAYYGGKEVMGVYIKRFFPWLFSYMVRKLKVNA